MLVALSAAATIGQGGPKLPALSDTVVYEANLRAEGPNVGFKALTRRLDSIRALGANVLWLMPVQPVGKIRSAGGLGSPYAMADFTKVNPEFGSPEEFENLIIAAHRRRMSVIIDWVANHSAWDNPWLKLHPDWYRHDAGGNVISPPNTNWKDVAQVDFRNHSMRGAMISSMQGWVTRYHIDGFRCDSAEFVPVDFWREAVSSLRAHSLHPLLMLAEGYKPELCDAGFDMAYGWHFCDRLLEISRGRKASDLAASVAEEAQGMRAGKERLRFVTNHDKDAWDGSPLELYKSPLAIKTAFALEAFYGGVPLIYTGQEVNWPGRIPIFDHTTIDWSRDPNMRSWIADILRVRHGHPVLREGALKDYSTADTVVLHRTLGDDEALVLVNMRPVNVQTSLPPSLFGKWNDGLVPGRTLAIGEPNLHPYTIEVLFRKRSAGQASLPDRDLALLHPRR